MSGQPLDEIQWRDIEAVRFYGGINANNIHLYFMHSPYCDPSSNNKIFENQAQHDPQSYGALADRKQFEDKMRNQMGVTYLVEDGPIENTPDMNLVWVVNKVNRIREYDVQTTKIEGTYYAIAENVYQAPSIKDVLTCRLLTITDNLQKLYETASEMQYFDPSQGYSIFPPEDSTPLHHPSTTKASVPSTPHVEPSQHLSTQTSTPRPTSHTQTSTGTSKPTKAALLEEHSLLQSLTLSMRYRDEFMDENPLTGGPGNFAYTSTQATMKKKAAASAAAITAAAGTVGKTSLDTKNVEGKSAAVSSAPSPASAVDLKISTSGLRKGSRVGDEGGKTPISATSAKTRVGRKRSRAPASPDA